MLTCEKCGAKDHRYGGGRVSLRALRSCLVCRKRDAGRGGIQAGHGGAPAAGGDLELEEEGCP